MPNLKSISTYRGVYQHILNIISNIPLRTTFAIFVLTKCHSVKENCYKVFSFYPKELYGLTLPVSFTDIYIKDNVIACIGRHI